MLDKQNRWRQRYQNFSQAYQQLEEAVAQQTYSNLERSGLIQTFEFTFELGWKTLKDFLESEGYSPKSPRESIKQAFQVGYIKQGELWLEALEKRNLLSHAYDEALAKQSEKLIKSTFFPLLQVLNHFFKERN
jgi:nucleotidyltransferase substrate binding protein (TIGR01987 family)